MLLVSCEKETEELEPISKTNKYYPLVIRHWVSYQIEEIVIDLPSGVNDTVRYQIKEKVESLIDSTKYSNTYRLERYYRITDQQEWVLLNIWEVRQYPTRIHRIEDNVEYIKIITPASLDTEWNTNTFNHSDEQMCSIEKIETVIISGISVETAFITHYDQLSLVGKDLHEEQFSENIGLTKKSIINVDLNIDPNLPWEEKVTKGSIYYQNYIEHNE